MGMLIAWFSVIVFLLGTVLYFAAPGKWSGYGLALVTGSMAGICVAFATKLVRLL